MSSKHSKYRNTGLLFELLVRKVTADTLEGKDSPALKLLRKYFVNTELGKEYKLYEQLSHYKNLQETKAEIVINSLIDASTKLNRAELRRQKYNLVKEIKAKFQTDSFFKARVNNYKIYAAFNNLVETKASDSVDVETVINNKLTLLEHFTAAQPVETTTDAFMTEVKGYDKSLRILTYRILLEKFNEKYADLKPLQKEVLKEIITSVESPDKLKEIYNTRIEGVKKGLALKYKQLEDKVVKIKLQEVFRYLKPVGKADKVTNEDVVNLLQYYELLNEL